jgi:hypothetical protein
MTTTQETTMTTQTTPTVIATICHQIGRSTILAVSGGRINGIDDNTIELPCGKGYSVRVEYNEVPDLYTVTRMFRRGTKEWNKGSVDHVYFDQLSEVVWIASCFISYPEFSEVI